MPIPPTFLCSSLFKDGFLGNRHAYFLFYLAKGDMWG